MRVYKYIALIGGGLLAASVIAIWLTSGGSSPGDSPLAHLRAQKAPAPPLFEGKLKAVPELATRTLISNQVKHEVGLPWEPESYNKYENIPAAYRSKSERTPSGIWKLSVFYGSVEKDMLPYTMPEEEFVGFGPGLDRWVKRMPESPTPIMYNAIAMLNYAKTATFLRVKGETMTQQRLDEYHSRIKRAEQYLLDHKTVGSTDPHFYKLLIDVMALRGAPFEDIEKILVEGSDRHPYYYETYFSAIRAAVNSSAPDDAGERVARIVAMGATKTSAQDGAGFYARGYWFAAHQFKQPVFAIPMIDWEKMRTGMKDVYARYGEPWNANNFALFSCWARDGEAARHFLPAVLARPVESVWDTAENLQKCVEISGRTASAAH